MKNAHTEEETKKIMESLKHAQETRREMCNSILVDISVALKSYYKIKDYSFTREFIDDNLIEIIVDGFRYTIAIKKEEDL